MKLKLFVVLFAAAVAIARSQRLASCETRNCPSARPTCVEGPIETVCRENERGREICRERRNITCERLPAPRLPTDCSMITCVQGQACMIDETSGRPKPLCVLTRFVPTSCDDIECEEGTRCEQRVRNRDEFSIARCITIRQPSVERDCSQVECSEGMQCELSGNNQPRCVSITSCDDLMCDKGFECRERGRRVTCEQVDPPTPQLQTCDDIDCPGGFECEMRGDRRIFVPICKPVECPVPRRPTFCEELECGEEERCRVFRNDQGRRTRAVCLPLRDSGKLHVRIVSLVNCHARLVCYSLVITAIINECMYVLIIIWSATHMHGWWKRNSKVAV